MGGRVGLGVGVAIVGLAVVGLAVVGFLVGFAVVGEAVGLAVGGLLHLLLLSSQMQPSSVPWEVSQPSNVVHLVQKYLQLLCGGLAVVAHDDELLVQLHLFNLSPVQSCSTS